jgi:hypothetical protein
MIRCRSVPLDLLGHRPEKDDGRRLLCASVTERNIVRSTVCYRRTSPRSGQLIIGKVEPRTLHDRTCVCDTTKTIDTIPIAEAPCRGPAVSFIGAC